VKFNSNIKIKMLRCKEEVDTIMSMGMSPAGKRKLTLAKYTVDWAPAAFRIFEPLRIVYPIHVIDDHSVDNYAGYVQRSASAGASVDTEPLVPVGPRVAPFYRHQYLPVAPLKSVETLKMSLKTIDSTSKSN
jgi:hypothetical protein